MLIVTMFEDEARVTSRIKHPNIVRTHEFFTDGENKVLAMEFIQDVTVGPSWSVLKTKPGLA